MKHFSDILLLFFIQDTLTEMGHDISEAEELVGKVISVVDSTDHFILQTIPLLDEVLTLSLSLYLSLSLSLSLSLYVIDILHPVWIDICMVVYGYT